ncbi:SIN3-HDAC complex-associated factor [Exaiptasia diaphana]|uniref:Uncharacterized protein n=1 Tax=Exaiptasia diaphana TaxID=2652724 RepID=A0A913XTP5_EXADI|nr:SIN3-HDAC complex-associated factor [Exaiptasia diaphana]KXJ09452.1 Protein FAM60A [Exaiptasia diaphana]
MFSTHRPKIYRSRLGCCICGAKSSSSRFTSSAKYEQHFEGCFVVNEKRQGEICNACVLLVKRWSKLPQGSTKNWKHVVDSKASVKRTVRPRRASRSSTLETRGRKSIDRDLDSTSVKSEGNSVDVNDNIEDEIDCPSPPSLACVSPSPPPSDTSDESGSYNSSTKTTSSTACQTSFLFPALKSPASNKLPYIDLSLWRQEEICCGMIFKGPCGEVLVDPKLLNPFCTCSTSQQKVNGYIASTKNTCKIPV